MLCIVAPPVFAAEKEFPILQIVNNVSGVPISFSGAITLSQSKQCVSMKAIIEINLNDLFAKITQIAKASGVERNEHCGSKVAIKSVNIRRDGGNLLVNTNGLVGRQECVKINVPEFRGLKMTMKTRIIARNTFKTNVNMEGVFQPIIINSGKALSMKLVSNTTPRFSNEFDRFLASDLNLGARIYKDIALAINSSLVIDKALSQLPDQVRQLGITMKDVTIVDANGSAALRVQGNIPVPNNLRPTIFSFLGFNGGQCP
ncbi:MAG: hypothetical protein GY761_02895 [Hyphomicrobiales bacterium]|nr:hypothetical protein [Hyphomicrobiales bacterium]